MLKQEIYTSMKFYSQKSIKGEVKQTEHSFVKKRVLELMATSKLNPSRRNVIFYCRAVNIFDEKEKPTQQWT